MRVAVVGAGPLGLFYAAQLARRGAEVTLIRRRGGAGLEHWDIVSRTSGARFEIGLPVALEIPTDLHAVVIAVRAEQLTDELLRQVTNAKPRAIVCLTPALGAQLEGWRAGHPELVMAMPAVAAEVSGRSVGYWAAPNVWGAPSTLIERRDDSPALRELVSLLRRAGLAVSWVRDARERTRANTVALFPLHVAVYLEPSLRRWSKNHRFTAELAAAIDRACALALQIGPVDRGLRVLAMWLSSPWRLRLSVRVLFAVAPRLAAFLEHHFGPKLAAQHAVLQRDVEVMARDHQLPEPLPRRWALELQKSAN